ILGLAGHEFLGRRTEVERRLDLHWRPLAEAEIARLSLADDLGQRLQRLFQRRVAIVTVALVEIDVVGLEPTQRVIDLLEDLASGEPLVLTGVVHREEELRREHVGITGPVLEGVSEELLSGAATVDVRRVDQVHAYLARPVVAGPRGIVLDPDAVGQPAPERDLGDLKIAGAQLAVAHTPLVPDRGGSASQRPVAASRSSGRRRGDRWRQFVVDCPPELPQADMA